MFIELEETVVKNENGDSVSLDFLLRNLNSPESFYYDCFGNLPPPVLTDLSAVALSNALSGIDVLHLNDIPDTFHFDALAEFMQKNQTTWYNLTFRHNISEDYIRKLQTYLNFIGGAYRHTARLEFPGRIDPPYYDLDKLDYYFDVMIYSVAMYACLAFFAFYGFCFLHIFGISL